MLQWLEFIHKALCQSPFSSWLKTWRRWTMTRDHQARQTSPPPHLADQQRNNHKICGNINRLKEIWAKWHVSSLRWHFFPSPWQSRVQMRHQQWCAHLEILCRDGIILMCFQLYILYHLNFFTVTVCFFFFNFSNTNKLHMLSTDRCTLWAKHPQP